MLHNERSHNDEKPVHRSEEEYPFTATRKRQGPSAAKNKVFENDDTAQDNL